MPFPGAANTRRRVHRACESWLRVGVPASWALSDSHEPRALSAKIIEWQMRLDLQK
jgi:hypothetical protein